MANKGNRNRYSISCIGGYYLSLIYKIIFMKVLLFSLFVFISIGAVSAQSSKKPFIGRTWLKPHRQTVQNDAAKSFVFPGSMANPDTSFYQFKAMVALAYSYPDYKAMGLTGISFQHVLYKFQTPNAPDQIYCDWAINLVYGGGGTTNSETKDVDFSSFGVGASFFDKKVSLYILGSRYSDKILPTPTNPDGGSNKKTIKPVVAVAFSL